MKRIVLVLVLVGVPVTHTALTLSYLSPRNPLADRARPTADAYMKTLGFQQRWSMFAPEPSTGSPGLWYRIDAGGGWLDWNDPAAAMLDAHQSNRLSVQGKHLNVHQHIGRSLFGRIERSVPDGERRPRAGLAPADHLMQCLRDTPEYRLAARYICDRVRLDYPGARPARVEVAAVFVATVPFSRAREPDAAREVFGYTLLIPTTE